MGLHLNFAIRFDLVLGVIWMLCAFLIKSAGYVNFDWKPFFFSGVAFIVVAHLVVYFKIIVPLNRFSEIADNIADGDIHKGVEEIRKSELGNLQNSFTKITANLVEHQEEIGRYMQTIGDINKQLEEQVEALSVLYSASKLMGTTLNLETLVRTLISLTFERLSLNGTIVMLYNESSDQVTVKDLIGFSPELFAKFKFYSDNKVVSETFASETCWRPSEADKTLMVAEFETDIIRSMHLFFPMRIKDHFVGIFILGEKKEGGNFSKSEIQLIQALVGLATMAFNNAKLFERSETTKDELDRKVFNLMTLQQSGKVLSSTLNLDELIRIAIDMFLETVYANRGVLMITGDDNVTLEVMACKGINSDELKELEKDSGEVWAMTTLQKEKKPILAQELATKSVYQSYLNLGRALPFAVYVPLLREGDLFGVVKIGPKINEQMFTENDLEFFSTLASQAVIAFENARLYSLAITDSITKLYVHRYFQLRLEEEVKRSQRYNSTISLLMCDIDHFKEINDTYGHQQGDIILKEISNILRHDIRTTDIAARYGGEEFVIILPETTMSDAQIVAERIRRDIAKKEFPGLAATQPCIHVTISIGVASFPINANNKDELIQKADSSLYQAKGAGRNQVVLCGID